MVEQYYKDRESASRNRKQYIIRGYKVSSVKRVGGSRPGGLHFSKTIAPYMIDVKSPGSGRRIRKGKETRRKRRINRTPMKQRSSKFYAAGRGPFGL